MAANDTTTPNLKLTKIGADRLNWSEKMNANLSAIDAAISAYFTIDNLQGIWQNSTAYTVGQAVIDAVSAVVYVCQVDHTSANVPTTFAEDRAAHSSYWSVYSSPARARGAWTSNTAYALNDFVVSGSYYAICIEAHTSGLDFATDLAGGKWSVLIDLSGVTFAPDPTGNPNKFAVTNPGGTDYDLADASTAADLMGFTSATKPMIPLATVAAIRTYLELEAAPMITADMTVSEIRTLVTTHNVVYFAEQLTLTDTLDLSGLEGKTLISLVSGKPLIISTAEVGMRVGGAGHDWASQSHAPQFYGEWFFSFDGTPVYNTTAVFVVPSTYRLHFDCLYGDGWGVIIKATKGDVRTTTINRLKMYNIVADGVKYYSSDPLKEMDSIFIYECEGNATDALATANYFSFGPSNGSGGKIGGVITDGILYRQGYVSHFWAVIIIESIAWDAGGGGILTMVLKDYHDLTVGDNVWNGGSDNAAVNNLTSTPNVALAGTEEKTIKIAMAVDPGTINVPGYFTYDYRIVPGGFNNYERPRKFTFENVSGRAQNNGGHRVEDGGNLVWKRCVVDDAGASIPNGLYVTGSWAAGVVTYKTWTDSTATVAAPHLLSPSEFFNTRVMNPTAYNVSLAATTTPDTQTITAPMTDDPGVMLRGGAYYKPLQLDADAWYFGPNAGAYMLDECEAHENYRSAVYDDRLTNERSVIKGCRFYNQSYGLPNPPSPVADLYFRPGRGNMTIVDNIIGAGDTWRFASKSFRFTGQPSVGDWISLAIDASATPRYFLFETAVDPDASQPNVEIGATLADTLNNLAQAIANDGDVSSNGVQAVASDEFFNSAATPDRVWIIRAVPGAIGLDFRIAKNGTNIVITPAGPTLGGGTGQPTTSYAIMNVRNGEHGNEIARNQLESHTVAETNMPEDEVPIPPAENLIDNGDVSLDQKNEGAVVNITAASGAGIASVDRWTFIRGTTGGDPTVQRVAGDGRTYALRLTGAANVTSIIGRQRWEGARAASTVGKLYTFSLEIKSPDITGLFLRVVYADALDNFAAVTQIINRQFVVDTAINRIATTFVMPAGAANGVEFQIRNTTGLVAGETFDIQAIKFEESPIATDFQDPAPDNNLFACQRYYRKSFVAGTAPAQNAGVSGATVSVQAIAGAVAQQFKAITFSPPMWKAPTVTLYNPSAANAQIRNTTTNADWTASAAASITTNGMTINGTGAAGSAAGDNGAVHYTANAEP